MILTMAEDVYKRQVKAANNNANGRVPSARKVNGKALSADITLTPKDIGTLNSTTMSVSYTHLAVYKRQGQHHRPAAEQNALVVIHRNQRCETVLPEHGTGRRAGGRGTVRQPAGEP